MCVGVLNMYNVCGCVVQCTMFVGVLYNVPTMQGVYNIHGGKFGNKLGQSGNRFWKSALSFGNSTRMHFLWRFKMKQLLMINGET